MIEEKQFRQDLYFRIKGVTILIPPLRERREDIPLLIHYFIKQAEEKHHKEVEGITPEAQQFLISRPWKGNVRELKTTIDNMVILSPTRRLGLDSLPDDMRPITQPPANGVATLAGVTLEQAEKELIRNALKMTEGNREQAARLLGIGERTLYRKIKEYGLTE
jgi:two-component system response regulator HydG